MSTIKFPAKRINVDWKKLQPSDSIFFWFTTQDNRKFTRVDFNVNDYPDIKIFLVKKLNVHHSKEWDYELYEVPRKDLELKRFPGYWKHFTGCSIVYEVKK